MQNIVYKTNRIKRVSIVIDDFRVSSGIQKLVLMTYGELVRRGYNTAIFTPEYNKEKCFPELTVDKKIINLKNIFLSSTSIFGSLGYIIRYLFLYLQNRAFIDNSDLILIEDELGLLLLLFVKKGNKKIIWYLNNGFSAMLIDVIRSKKNYKDSFLTKPMKSITLFVKRIIYSKIFQKIDQYATYDKYNKNLIKKWVSKNVTEVYVGSDNLRKTHFKRKIGKNKELRLLSIGVLYTWRRYEDIINAVYELKSRGMKISLTIVGNPDLSKNYYLKLLSLVEKYHLSTNIFFKSYVTDKEKEYLYKSSDAFVFVSNLNTFGMSVFEAISSGLPVIVTNNIGVAELLDSQTAFLVNPKSPGEIAKQVINISRNYKSALQKSKLAYKKLHKFLSWKSYVSRIESLIS